MYKIVPSDRLASLLGLAERLVLALEARAGCCPLASDARTSLEWWDAIEERSSQAEEGIQYLADTAKGLLDVVDRLESALDISIPEAAKLHEAIALVNEAFPAERQGQHEERG